MNPDCTCEDCAMHVEHIVVVHSCESTLSPGSWEDAVLLSYDADEPFMVKLTFAPDSCGPVTWEMSRDGFRSGLLGVPGVGDVTYTLMPKTLAMRLVSNFGEVTVLFNRSDADSFIRATRKVVEFGEEDISDEVDAAIELLRSAR